MALAPGFRSFSLLCTVVFLAFLTLGIPLAVLPQQIHGSWGFSAFVVGLVIGSQSAATVLTRHWAGTSADRGGAKPTVQRGLLVCILAGCVYWVSAVSFSSPSASLAILILARLILGLGESLLITGALTWGIGLVGGQYAGQVMAWNGIAMYGALAIGAPIGLWITSRASFAWAMFSVVLCAGLGFFLSYLVPAVSASNAMEERMPFLRIVKSIWYYGLGMGCATLGFGALSTFIVLYLQVKGWGDAGTALLIFGGAYISVRLVGGHWPDRTGGRSTAIVSLGIEGAGQLCLWLAPNLWVAYIGVALVGFGFSLVFPSFGIQAAKSVPVHSRGAALGGFFAFFDIALGLTGPVCGAIGAAFGYPEIYAFAFFVCLIGFGMAMGLKKNPIPLVKIKSI